MTKAEKLEKALSDHHYAIRRIGELERELTSLRRCNSDLRKEVQYLNGSRPRPMPYDHHY